MRGLTSSTLTLVLALLWGCADKHEAEPKADPRIKQRPSPVFSNPITSASLTSFLHEYVFNREWILPCKKHETEPNLYVLRFMYASPGIDHGLDDEIEIENPSPDELHFSHYLYENLSDCLDANEKFSKYSHAETGVVHFSLAKEDGAVDIRYEESKFLISQNIRVKADEENLLIAILDSEADLDKELDDSEYQSASENSTDCVEIGDDKWDCWQGINYPAGAPLAVERAVPD